MTYFLQSRYIAFAGVDGSGKSTQAAMLNSYIRNSGYNSFLLENNNEVNIQRLNASAAPDMHGRERFGDDLYEFAKYFDFSNDMDAYVRPLLSNGTNVIASRCIVTLLARASVLGSTILTEHKELITLLPLPDLIIHLKTDAVECSKRVEKRGKDTETVSYLEELEFAISEMSSEYKMITVDGNGTPQTVLRDIIKTVESAS